MSVDFYLSQAQIPGQRPGELVSIYNSGLSPELLQRLVPVLYDCFHNYNIGMYKPSSIYLVSPDPAGRVIVATISIALMPDGTYYIYNVCTGTEYRRRQLARRLFNVLPRAIYYLEVDPKNEPAYRLYKGLGFIKIGVSDRGFDILRLDRK